MEEKISKEEMSVIIKRRVMQLLEFIDRIPSDLSDLLNMHIWAAALTRVLISTIVDELKNIDEHDPAELLHMQDAILNVALKCIEDAKSFLDEVRNKLMEKKE